MKILKLTPVVLAIALLTGCASTNKEQIGTVAGGVAGAVIGKQLGGDRGAIIGAVIGAAIGNRIGAHLDEEDRKKLAALEQQALTTGKGGSFTTNKSQAVVTVEASAPTMEKPRDYGLAGSVKPQPLVLIDPITIRAYVDTPIYNSTTEAQAPKMVIQQGVPMRISAKVANENWSVVGDDRVGLGYVHRRYLEAGIVSESKAPPRPAETMAKAPAPAKPTGPAAKPTAPARAPTTVARAPTSASTSAPGTAPALSKEQYEKEMAALNAAYQPRAGTRAGAQPPTQTAGATPQVTVAQVSTECKVVSRKVVPKDGEPFSESIKYCSEPPKGWQAQTVT